MKYLKYNNQFINERFSSNSISKTIKWLNKKFKSGKGSSLFLSELKKILKLDIPLDKVSDDCFSYMSTRKALKIFPEGDVNKLNIYCIKYWFSLENGLEITTVTPFKNIDVNLEHINNELPNLKTGSLELLTKYEEFKHGDTILAKLSNRSYAYVECYLFIDDDGDKYLIHNADYNGSIPSVSDEWKKHGSKTWIISKHSIDSDVYDPYLYKESELELHIKDDNNIKSNLNIDRYEIESSLILSSNDLKNIENSDFAVVMWIDKLIENIPNSKLPSITRKDRNDSRLGSTYLMSDSEIKRINIYNRLGKSLERNGINPTSVMDLNNLQDIIIRLLGESKSFILLITSRHILDSFYSSLKRFILTIGDSKIEFNDNDKHLIKSSYGDVLNLVLNRLKVIEDINSGHSVYINEYLNDDENKYKINIFKELEDLSIFLNVCIRGYNINTMEDLIILISKIKSISISILDNDIFKMSIFRYCENYGTYNTLNTYEDYQYEKDLSKIASIKNLINSYFR